MTRTLASALLGILFLPRASFAGNPVEVPFSVWKIVDKAYPSDLKADRIGLKTYGNVAWDAVDKDVSEFRITAEASVAFDWGFGTKIVYDDWMEETLNSDVKAAVKRAELTVKPKHWQGRRVRKVILSHGQSGLVVNITRFAVVEEQGTSVFIDSSSLGGLTLNPGKNRTNNILLLKMQDEEANRPALEGYKGQLLTVVAAHTGDPRFGHSLDLDMRDAKGNLQKRVSVPIDNQVKEIAVKLPQMDYSKVEKLVFANTANVHVSVRRILVGQAMALPPSPCSNLKPLNDRLQEWAGQASGLSPELKKKLDALLIEYRMKE